MFTLICTRRAVVAGALLGALSAAASAGDHHRSRPDVDIESLHGDLRLAGGEWLLEVRYEVEVEDYRPALGELELVLFVTEHGGVLIDHSGRPIEIVVPLDCPSDRDDDEFEFEDRFAIALPAGAFDHPDHLRLEGIVVRAGDDRPLDRKDKSIDFERPRSSIRYGRSASVGIGVSVRSVGHYRSSVQHRRVVRHSVGVTRHRASVEHRRVGVSRRHETARSHRPRVERHRPSTRGRSGHVERRSSERHGRSGHVERRSSERRGRSGHVERRSSERRGRSGHAERRSSERRGRARTSVRGRR